MGSRAWSRNAAAIQGKPVSPTAPTNGQLLGYVSATGLWTPTAPAGATGERAASNTTSAAQSGNGDLQSLVLPAGALSADGDQLHIFAWGHAATVSGLIQVSFGATVVESHNFPGATCEFILHVFLVRTGATAQVACGSEIGGGATTIDPGVTRSTPAETLANAITIKTNSASITGGTLTLYGLTYYVQKAA